MTEHGEFNWMRDVLQSLFFEVPRESAIDAIRSPDALATLRAQLEAPSSSRPGISGIPAGEYGDNLLLALLALRTKFSADEASAKLETNIAMRASRPGAQRR